MSRNWSGDQGKAFQGPVQQPDFGQSAQGRPKEALGDQPAMVMSGPGHCLLPEGPKTGCHNRQLIWG